MCVYQKYDDDPPAIICDYCESEGENLDCYCCYLGHLLQIHTLPHNYLPLQILLILAFGQFVTVKPPSF